MAFSTTPTTIARRLRRRLRRAAAVRRFGPALDRSPILFANAFPKSGTHLLTQILSGFPRIGPAVLSGLPAAVMYEGASSARVPVDRILAGLARLKPGDVAYGHLHALPPLVEALCREGVAFFFLFRDPRDVAVSHAHYVAEIETDHAHHAHYRALPDFETRLRTSILGRPELDGLFPDIGRRFAPFSPWLDQPQVCTLKYEDLMVSRQDALSRILDFAVQRGFSPAVDRETALARIAASIRPDESPTFRKGSIGGWRERFTPEHRRLFKEVAGELLVQLGYEQNLDW